MFDFIKEDEQDHQDSINRIFSLEEKYKIRFPSLLKDFYSKYDGASMELSKFEVGNTICEVSKIIPIIAEKMDFESIVDNDRIDGLLPETYYPLARDRGGNIYYWDSTNENIYVVYNDDYENPFKVANSISDFFELLTKYKSTDVLVEDFIEKNFKGKYEIIKPGKMSSNYLKDGIEFVIRPNFSVKKMESRDYNSAHIEYLKDGNIKVNGFLNDIKKILSLL